MLSGKGKQSRTRRIVCLVVTGLILLAIAAALRFDPSILLNPGRIIFQETTGHAQKTLFMPLANLQGSISAHLHIQEILEENRLLKAELEQLRQEITSYREAAIENRRLRALLNMRQSMSARMIVANVVGFDLSPWKAVIKIDRGRKDGVKKDMPVLTGAGVIGRVFEVSPSFSQVILLTDYDSRIAALIQRNRARGILKGQGRSSCTLEYVGKGVDVEPGDRVITSGLDGIFPKGLLLGEVEEVSPGPSGDLFQTIKVRPYSKLDTVEGVLVMLEAPEEEEASLPERAREPRRGPGTGR